MKKGVTISILAVTVVLMFILATTATVIGIKSIQTASYEEFLSQISRVSNSVNKYFVDNQKLPIKSQIVAKEGLSLELKAEMKKKHDDQNNVFVLDMSKIKVESVNIGSGTTNNMDVFIVAENTNNVYYLKGVNYKNKTYYGLPINSQSQLLQAVPYAWQENISTIVDGVPIPKGFVASSVDGENTRDGGLVIYEGEIAVTNSNVDYARKNRNQYVWVPVDNFTEFVRKDYINETSTVVDDSGNYYALGTQSKQWEVMVDPATNLPVATQNLNFMSPKVLAEVQEMYSSVKKYKGFYIARYEAGLEKARESVDEEYLKGSNVYSVMGKYPYNYTIWGNSLTDETGGVVEVARSIYTPSNNNYGAISTLIYGVQWDAVLEWWQNSQEKTLQQITAGGNFLDTEISYTVINEGAEYAKSTNLILGEYNKFTEDYKKSNQRQHLFTTGALKTSITNNIYDMAGNIYEWTMEGRSTYGRTERGGSYLYNAESVGNRAFAGPTGTDGYPACRGFRVALYIKLTNEM